jgi:hypothetical protein
MMRPVVQNLLLAYSVAMTTVIGISLVVAHAKEGSREPPVLTVQQIRVVEPDGTLRTVISNKARFPDLMIGGKSYKNSRNSAGMLFFDEEGSELGGLIYGGRMNKDGKPSNAGSLTFDRYQKDQVVQLLNLDDVEGHYSGLKVLDRSDKPTDHEGWARYSAMPDSPEKKAERRRLLKADPFANRLFVGRDNGDAMLQLSDGQGSPRLMMTVKENGEAAIQFLDKAGKVTKTIDGESSGG